MVKRRINFILLFVICIIIGSVSWANKMYDTISFEEILYHINPNIVNSGVEVVKNFIFNAFIPGVLLFIIFYFVIKAVMSIVTGYDFLVDFKLGKFVKLITIKE